VDERIHNVLFASPEFASASSDLLSRLEPKPFGGA